VKWLALALLAINLVHYGWQLDQELRRARANRAQALVALPGARPLTLLRELDAPPALRATADSALDYGPAAEAVNDPDLAVESAVPAELQAATGAGPDELVNRLPDLVVPDAATGPARYTCFSLGPLPAEQHAVWLADWFRARMIPVHVRESEAGERNLLWVYLAPLPSRDDARAVAETLARKGIRDFRLIDRGDLANAVSLGLFSSQQAVNDRLRELREQGFQPVVVPYENMQRARWVDVRIPGDDPVIEEMFAGFPGRYGSVPKDCAEIAMDQPAP
jgi:cell division septation protein DedD